MKAARQDAMHRCGCGRAVPVVRVTAYEFDYRCACGRAGRWAWAHANPPPIWNGHTVGQLELF